MSVEDLMKHSRLEGQIHSRFSEKELPKGSMMVIGRSLDGEEIATVLHADRPASWVGTVRAFINYLHRFPSTP